MRTSETLQLADRMRGTGCVAPSQLWHKAMEEGGDDGGSRLYREAMIHAGGITKVGGEPMPYCPICGVIFPKSGETHDRPTVQRESD
jgi:hypothetical protein